MISFYDVQATVTDQLRTTKIPVTQTDVQEGFDRPSFFVQLDNPTSTGYVTQIHKSMTVRIYYFPENKHIYTSEILKMQETLTNLFDMKLSVKDRLFNIDNLSFAVTDGVLECSFGIAFFDGRQVEEKEKAGSLEFNLRSD